MNDYKDLIEYLREMHDVMLYDDSIESGTPEEMITDIDAIACKEAADAIEQLVKERDAVVADLKEVGFCMTCKHLVSTQEEKLCRHCSILTGVGEDNWEWRGVQK